MKYQHLERLRVALTVRGPLFIGSGEKLQSKEYILDARNHVVLVPSLPDMAEALMNSWRRGMSDDFIAFMMDSRQRRLSDFLTSHGIAIDPPPAWVKYSVNAQSDFTTMNTLHTFVRDADGAAYIPGSSIKGALRTALIADRMDDRHKSALWRELTANKKDRRASAVEEALRVLPCAFKNEQLDRRNAVNDLLRAVQISDSAPFDADTLTVCRRHWLSSDGGERPSRAPIFMECLRPGAETSFYLTIDRALWPKDEDPLDTLRRALTDWDALCHQVHDRYFQQSLVWIDTADGAPIVLGGGTGFQRKSLVYRARPYPEEAAQLAHEVLREQFTRKNGATYKPPKTARTAPYMFKAASFEGRLYPMGVCVLKL